MLKYLSADYLIPVNSSPIQNGIIVLDNNGRIVNILSKKNDIPEGIHIEKHKGIIVPGFINCHCHLELSHLHGKIAKKTGLIEFLKSVARGPKYSSDVILDEINRADEAMYNAGIVAVADIANTIYSKERKLSSKIYYHTFSEVFGFEP